MVLINSTNLMAQCDTSPFAVNGEASENFANLEQSDVKTSKPGENQKANCGGPIEEVIVYGHAISLPFGPIIFIWTAFPLGGGGGGTTIMPVAQVDANKACRQNRLDIINSAFIEKRTLSHSKRTFYINNPLGSIFSHTLPNGSVIRGTVSGPMFTRPIIREASNSCG